MQLITSRLGTVTTSSVMIDDVVGLIMVQIILNLGGSSDSFSAVTVIRPLFVSIRFSVGVVLVCRFVAHPILIKILRSKDKLPRFTYMPQFAFLSYTCLLVRLVASAIYAGTSSLFAVYLAGVITSWFNTLACTTPHSTAVQLQQNEDNHSQEQAQSEQAGTSRTTQSPGLGKITSLYIYEHYYYGPVKRILIPMFFCRLCLSSDSAH
jgi:hypothetical protein